MTSKQKRSAQAANRKFRSDRSRLKKLGLITKRVDLRKKPTTYQKKLIRYYRELGIFSRKAKVVSTASPAQAAKFRGSFPVVGNKLVVSRAKGETIAFNKKTGELKTTRKVGGKRVTKTISNGELAPLKPGQYYVIEFAGGQRFRTNDFATLQTFMQGYEKKEYKPFKDWRKYVQIETLEEMKDGETYTPISKYKPLYKKAKKSAHNKTSRSR